MRSLTRASMSRVKRPAAKAFALDVDLYHLSGDVKLGFASEVPVGHAVNGDTYLLKGAMHRPTPIL